MDGDARVAAHAVKLMCFAAYRKMTEQHGFTCISHATKMRVMVWRLSHATPRAVVCNGRQTVPVELPLPRAIAHPRVDPDAPA